MLDGLRESIAGVSIAQLAEEFGTPTYIYDAAVIDKQIEKLRDFDVIRFAQKANSNLAVLRRMRDRGVLLDAVSAGEVLRARSAGYLFSGDPPPVVFTADLFDREALDIVRQYDLHCNLGSPDMMEQLSDIQPSADITLRINPGFGHGHSEKTNTGGPQSKHGIWHEQLPECVDRAHQCGLHITGLHMHIGSGTDFEHLAQVCDAMTTAAQIAHHDLTMLSAGGGLPTVYQPGDHPLDVRRYFDRWDQTRKELQSRLQRPLRLEIEPGRFLVADCGYLLCEIRAIKRMGENLFYLVDAGFNNLARPILYGAYHPISICHRDGVASRSQQPQPVIVGGPLCESGDIFTQQAGSTVAPRVLPPAAVGDWLVIECAGAYGFVMSSNYNSKPLAAEVLIEAAQPRCIRPRQSTSEIFAAERLVDLPTARGDSDG